MSIGALTQQGTDGAAPDPMTCRCLLWAALGGSKGQGTGATCAHTFALKAAQHRFAVLCSPALPSPQHPTHQSNQRTSPPASVRAPGSVLEREELPRESAGGAQPPKPPTRHVRVRGWPTAPQSHSRPGDRQYSPLNNGQHR